MTALKKSGRFGEIAVKIINHYKLEVRGIIKKIGSKGMSGLQKIVIDIRDDIIRIIQGEHIGFVYVEGRQTNMRSTWDKILEAAKRMAGKAAKITKEILAHYKVQILDVLGKLQRIAIDDTMKIVIDITKDVIQIMAGRHLVPTKPPPDLY